jgi:hypothetical protein
MALELGEEFVLARGVFTLNEANEEQNGLKGQGKMHSIAE